MKDPDGYETWEHKGIQIFRLADNLYAVQNGHTCSTLKEARQHIDKCIENDIENDKDTEENARCIAILDEVIQNGREIQGGPLSTPGDRTGAMQRLRHHHQP